MGKQKSQQYPLIKNTADRYNTKNKKTSLHRATYNIQQFISNGLLTTLVILLR